MRIGLRAVTACALLFGSNAFAAEILNVQVIGVRTAFQTFPDPSVEPPEGVSFTYDPGQFDPAVNPTAIPPFDPFSAIPTTSEITACTGHLLSFVGDPEYLQELVNFYTCAPNLPAGTAPYAYSYLLSALGNLGNVVQIGDDVTELQNALQIAPLEESDLCLADLPCVSPFYDLRPYVPHWETGTLARVTQAVVTCSMTLNYVGGSGAHYFGGTTNCSDVSAGVPLVVTSPSVTADAELRDVVSGAVIADAPVGSGSRREVYELEPSRVYTSEARSGTSFPTLYLPPVASKVKYTSTISAFGACPTGAATCNTEWIVLLPKSPSTNIELNCSKVGYDLKCMLDSPPIATAISGSVPKTPLH